MLVNQYTDSAKVEVDDLKIDFEAERPLFAQISEGIEDAILSGAFEEEEQIPSVSDFAVMYKINPGTALRGINMLVDGGIVYKKRGIGMFVSGGAAKKVLEKRREGFASEFLANFIAEAKRLGITLDELTELIKRGYEQ